MHTNTMQRFKIKCKKTLLQEEQSQRTWFSRFSMKKENKKPAPIYQVRVIKEILSTSVT